MNIPGLHHQIAMKRLAASELARQARGPQGDPRTAYEKGVEAERLAVESEKLAEHLESDLELLEGVQHLRCYLAASKHESRGRQDVMTYLNAAAGVLMLEIGTPEPERDFKPVPPAPAINGKKKK